jgi:cytochrome c551/c552
MIKVLVAALVGTIIGIVVMVAVIAISGTDTSGASSVGIGSLPLSTFTPSGSTATSTGSSNPTSGGTNPTSGGTNPTSSGGDANAGKAVFSSAGCSGCHTLAAAGATGAVGPNLDTALQGDAGTTPLPQFVKDSIINPDAVIAKGFTAGVMPPNFGTTLSATDINNLVALIVQGK